MRACGLRLITPLPSCVFVSSVLLSISPGRLYPGEGWVWRLPSISISLSKNHTHSFLTIYKGQQQSRSWRRKCCYPGRVLGGGRPRRMAPRHHHKLINKKQQPASIHRVEYTLIFMVLAAASTVLDLAVRLGFEASIKLTHSADPCWRLELDPCMRPERLAGSFGESSHCSSESSPRRRMRCSPLYVVASTAGRRALAGSTHTYSARRV